MAEQAENKGIALTEGETKLFISIMKNLQSDIVFNAEAVAEECGYKSAKVVKDRWSQVKKNKLGLPSAATPGKKAASTPGKKRTSGDEAADDADIGEPTPTKKARTPKAKTKKEAKVEQDADETKVKNEAKEEDRVTAEEEIEE